jgi:hypothetical protein
MKTQPGENGMGEERAAMLRVWTDFLDANPDDLTSPEGTPDHALVSFDNFAALVRDAADEARLAEQERCADLIESMDSAGLSRFEIATAIRTPHP